MNSIQVANIRIGVPMANHSRKRPQRVRVRSITPPMKGSKAMSSRRTAMKAVPTAVSDSPISPEKYSGR